MRKELFIPISEPLRVKSKLLHWASSRERVALLDSNYGDSAADPYSSFDFALAVDSIKEITAGSDPFGELEKFRVDLGDWLFGYFSYDLKNNIEQLSSKNNDRLGFPLMHFFCPRYLFLMKGNELRVLYLEAYDNETSIIGLYENISAATVPAPIQYAAPRIEAATSHADYIQSVEKLKQHIQRGDVYEVNFCREFFAEEVSLDATETFRRLNEISCAPFSCFYRMDDKYLLCASPERYLKKKGNKLLSQPIKGTAKRGATKEEDESLKKQLQQDEKERSENIMIVDLVRNDLSKVAASASVNVEELCGMYSFKQVHQLISTINCQLKPGIPLTDIIRATFPMGSMTGAPKVKAMQLIEKYEGTRRGLYSGAIGYITPEGDFDFNVVIRSILYNNTKRYVSFITGSAITAKSDAESEYRECLLKANAMLEVLSNS
jgi:para-aminobenzoate synthetase component 1